MVKYINKRVSNIVTFDYNNQNIKKEGEDNNMGNNNNNLGNNNNNKKEEIIEDNIGTKQEIGEEVENNYNKEDGTNTKQEIGEEVDGEDNNNNNNNNNNKKEEIIEDNNEKNSDINLENLIEISEDGDFYDDYKLIKLLGRGHYGKVFLAVKQNGENDNENVVNQEEAEKENVVNLDEIDKENAVAVKVISKSKFIEKPVHINLIQNEINVMKVVSDHPNICTLHKVYEDKEKIYIIMDYCDGGDLLNLCRRNGPLDETQTAALVYDISKALEYLHRLHLVHRDVKLENILVSTSNNKLVYKLADFGLATSMVIIDQKTKERRLRLLTSGCGSPMYVAPEILKNRPYDSKVDLWGLGVVVYSVLSTMNPFYTVRSMSSEELKKRIRLGQFVFFHKIWATVEYDTKMFICSLLETRPSKRLSAKEVLASEFVNKFCNLCPTAKESEPQLEH